MVKKSLIVTAAAAMLLVSGCITQEEKRGYAMEFAKPESLVPGQSTREDVVAALGSPSTTSSFGQETWYYIKQHMEIAALSRPEMTGSETLSVTFTPEGILQNLQRGKGENSRDIAIAKDVTKTEGNAVGVMEQLLGNLGRFNSPEGTKAGRVRGSSTRGGL